MNYLESVAYVESLAPTLLNPSLDRFRAFMQEQGGIQDRLNTIHIGGTNGKGSTAAIVDSVMRSAGMTVGRFTGPHLLRWNERFHVNGVPISDETFAAYATKLRAISEEFGQRHPEHGPLTWFEFLTAIAFLYFADCRVEAAVLEVGLGGRWDATNVLATPLVSAITTVDLDHTHILGNTVAEIAREKAGIIKPQVPVVTGCEGDALEEVRRRAGEQGAPLWECQAPHTVSGPQSLDLGNFDEACSQLALPGPHQHLNALVATAILAIAEGKLGRRLIKSLPDGFRDVYWPGRFQYVPQLNLVMDGAHNVAGAIALRRSLDELFPDRQRAFVLGFFQNKNVEGSIRALIRSGDLVFASEAHTARSIWPADRIVEECRKQGAEAERRDSIASALQAAQKTGRLVVAAGSFATIKESMIELGWRSVEDGRQISLPARTAWDTTKL